MSINATESNDDCCLSCTNMPSVKVKLPCCPILHKCCDKQNLDFNYRVRVPYTMSTNELEIVYEVTLHYKLVKCFRTYSPGDIVYTTTLLPGETIKLFSSDNKTSFTIDSETKTAVRQAAFSESSQYMHDFASAITNVNVNDLNTSTTSTSQSGSNWNAGGSAGLDLGFISIGGGGGGGGSSSSSNSLTSVLHQLNQNSQSASQRAQINVNTSSSISIGEVQTRTHTEGESEDVHESTSRTISNPNKYHSVTYYFYRINKCFTSRYQLADIHFRVLTPGAFNSLIPKPLKQYTGLTISPVPVLATASNSLDVVNNSILASNAYNNQTSNDRFVQPIQFSTYDPEVDKNFAIKVLQAALDGAESEVLNNLINSPDTTVKSTLIVNADIWCHDLSIPSPGVTVKGCLDECNIDENAVFTEANNKNIEDLNNQKLKIEKGKVVLLNKINDLLAAASLSDLTLQTSEALSILSDVIVKVS